MTGKEASHIFAATYVAVSYTATNFTCEQRAMLWLHAWVILLTTNMLTVHACCAFTFMVVTIHAWTASLFAKLQNVQNAQNPSSHINAAVLPCFGLDFMQHSNSGVLLSQSHVSWHSRWPHITHTAFSIKTEQTTRAPQYMCT